MTNILLFISTCTKFNYFATLSFENVFPSILCFKIVCNFNACLDFVLINFNWDLLPNKICKLREYLSSTEDSLALAICKRTLFLNSNVKLFVGELPPLKLLLKFFVVDLTYYFFQENTLALFCKRKFCEQRYKLNYCVDHYI